MNEQGSHDPVALIGILCAITLLVTYSNAFFMKVHAYCFWIEQCNWFPIISTNKKTKVDVSILILHFAIISFEDKTKDTVIFSAGQGAEMKQS